MSENCLENENLDTFGFSGQRPHNSRSTTFLSSVFTDQKLTSPSSPLSTLDSTYGVNPYICNRQVFNGQPRNICFQQLQIQTFPLLGFKQYTPSSDEYFSSTGLDSPMAGRHNPFGAINEAMSMSPTNMPHSIQSPPLPTTSPGGVRGITSPVSPSHDEATHALELVMSFLKSRPNNFAIAPEEYKLLGSIMEKLQSQSRGV